MQYKNCKLPAMWDADCARNLTKQSMNYGKDAEIALVIKSLMRWICDGEGKLSHAITRRCLLCER